MKQLDIQMTSCVRCHTVLVGVRGVQKHLEMCEREKRLEDALDELAGLGYESLSFDQIRELFGFLSDTDLSGDIIGDLISGGEYAPGVL